MALPSQLFSTSAPVSALMHWCVVMHQLQGTPGRTQDEQLQKMCEPMESAVIVRIINTFTFYNDTVYFCVTL